MLRCTRFTRTTAGGMVRFVASDMDSSILRNDHRLSEFTKRTLFQLTQERKIPFIFATGRLHKDVVVINERLQDFYRLERARHGMEEESDSTATPMYLITSNGAVVHNARTNELVMEECVPEPLVRELYTLFPASETRINTHLSQAGEWFCRADWQELLVHHQETGFRYEVLESIPPSMQGNETAAAADGIGITTTSDPLRTDTASTLRHDAPKSLVTHRTPREGDVRRVTKLFFTSWDGPLLDRVEALLRQRYGDRLTITYSSSYTVSITAAGTNKGKALRTVLSQLPPPVRTSSVQDKAKGLSLAEEEEIDERMRDTAAFGNDFNDACMLMSVGHGFLMGNANSRLIAECRGLQIIDSNENDGVAKKICELFGLNGTSTPHTRHESK